MQVKSNEQLFNELKYITARISLLNSIIQNDMEINEEDIDRWKEQVASSIKELWAWHKEVEKWILG
jgi:hypothetical protein